MTNGEFLAKTNQRTIHLLIVFLVWIVVFHSTSYNAFIFGIQASQRSPKMPSKTIQLPNDSPAKQHPVPNDSPAMQYPVPNDSPAKQCPVPNDGPAHFDQLPVPNEESALTILQICVPMATTSTGLQASNNCHSSLNDFTAPQAFPAMTATMIATITQVLAIATAITKATIKLVECFLHPTKTGANNATNESERFFASCSFWLSNYDCNNWHTKSPVALRP
jgi:hypothetical protein